MNSAYGPYGDWNRWQEWLRLCLRVSCYYLTCQPRSPRLMTGSGASEPVRRKVMVQLQNLRFPSQRTLYPISRRLYGSVSLFEKATSTKFHTYESYDLPNTASHVPGFIKLARRDRRRSVDISRSILTGLCVVFCR